MSRWIAKRVAAGHRAGLPVALRQLLFGIGLGCVSLCTLASGAALAQPAATQSRAALVRDTAASCVQSQVVKPANFSLTVGAVHRYCDCYAQHLIELMTADEMKAAERELSAPVKAKADAAAAACARRAR